MHNAFQLTGSIGYEFITLEYHTSYFVINQKGKTSYTEEQVVSKLEFLWRLTFFNQLLVLLWKQTTHPLADLFLFS